MDSDVRLVERCLNGEQGAWEELVKTYTRRVYAICYRFTGSHPEAQEISQEAFLRVFRTLQSFRQGEGSFLVWLTRLTRNLLIDHYRRSRLTRLTDPLESQEQRLESHGSESSGERRLEQREAEEFIQAGLQRLSPELRETLVLRDLEGYEYREIADVLQVPEGTVKSRLNRGRAELARALRRMKVAL